MADTTVASSKMFDGAACSEMNEERDNYVNDDPNNLFKRKVFGMTGNSKFLDRKVSSIDEAYDMYCAYAHQVGFSVRKDHTTFFGNSNEIKSKVFLCSKAGKKNLANLSSHEVKYRKANTRTGCAAMIKFEVDENGVWNITKFIESHNHELASIKNQHLLRSHRKLCGDGSSVLKSMTEAGIRTVDAFHFIAGEVGGVENIGFSRRDAYNFIHKERMSKIEAGDTATLIKLFRERQAHDYMFAWDVQLDEHDRLNNFFWIDGLGRLDYDYFGDVIVFDTSYRLNKYNLVCAPFVGVNHHWQNVLFGVAFLAEETIESFTWLFQTFIRILGPKHPTTIFTDQDQAMARAIAVVFPKTRHRLCQWHIAKKVPSKVSIFNTNKGLQSLFYKCLNKCDSAEEFEQTWSDMICKGSLQEHQWLNDLYKIKEKWSTAFNNEVFNMGILSTQRSESTNNVCHGVSKATSTITDCFINMEKVMMRWRRNEQDEDFKCTQTTITPCIKSSPILKQACKFYTKKMYSIFEAEFMHGIGALLAESIDLVSLFHVQSLEMKHGQKVWVVTLHQRNNNFTCSCRKFEQMGILCSHILKVVHYQHITKIPEKYMLPRWSIRAKKDAYIEKNYIESSDSTLVFQSHISRYSYQISSKAEANAFARQYMLQGLDDIAKGVDEIINADLQLENQPIVGAERTAKDPPRKRPKGVSNARLKGHWEKKFKKLKKSKGLTQEKTQHSTIQSIPQVTSQELSQEICKLEEDDLNHHSFSEMLNEIIGSTNVKLLDDMY